MVDILDRNTAALAPATEALAGTTDRRRPGRLSNPSPELIALMRKPSSETIRRLALYDAPSFVAPEQPAETRIDIAHFGRVMTAILGCGAAWGGSVALMLYTWG